MLAPRTIEIKSKTRGLEVSDWTIRQVSKERDDDPGWRFQAILTNESKSDFDELEIELRYHDSGGKFLGLDEGFVSGSDELKRGDDKAISIDLNPPPELAGGVFTVKASKSTLLRQHSELTMVIIMVFLFLLFILSHIL